MERLNHILGSSSQQRPQRARKGQETRKFLERSGPEELLAPQEPQEQKRYASPLTPISPGQRQKAMVTRPLYEQNARLGQRHASSAQPQHQQKPSRTRNTQEREAAPYLAPPEKPHAYRNAPPTPAPRTRYERQYAANEPPSYQRWQVHQEMAHYSEQPGQPRSSNSYYHTDDSTFTVQGDAIPEWEEEEEEETGMMYGDWEFDAHPAPPYRRTEVIADAMPYAIPSYHRVIREVAETSELEPRSRMTRRSSNLPAPTTQQSALPIPQTYIVEPKRSQRITQPLKPQNLAHLENSSEMPPSLRRPLPRSRDLIPGERTLTDIAMTKAAKASCPKCLGAGYLRANVPFGDPNFGKPIACECKEQERKEKRRQQLRAMSNMDAFRDSIFATFNSSFPGVQEAYTAALDYAHCPDGWLILIGPNGCGKTHLAAAIANQSLDEGAVVLFAVVPDLLDHLRAAFAPTATEVYDQLFAKMREAEILILDDLGAQQSSPWANEKLFQLLNYRYNMRLPTVITTNQKGLQGIDERIRSRLTDMNLSIVVSLDRARDYRPHRFREE